MRNSMHLQYLLIYIPGYLTGWTNSSFSSQILVWYVWGPQMQQYLNLQRLIVSMYLFFQSFFKKNLNDSKVSLSLSQNIFSSLVFFVENQKLIS